MASNRFFSETVKEVTIPYLPAKVALEDLSASGCLLSQEQLKLLVQVQAKLLDQRRYSKQEIAALIKAELKVDVDWPYSLIVHEDRIYAIYKGEKQGKHLGKGKHGKVKLAQCLNDNVFYALKLQEDPVATSREFNILVRVCETPQTRAIASRNTGLGKPQSMILMKLAHGQEIDTITDQELETSYFDADGKQVINGLMKPVLRIQLALDALIKLDRLHLVRHVIHRDLQPGNIMLDLVAQYARLIDYGLAMVAQEVNELKRSGSERALKGSTRNYSPKLRRHLPDIQRAVLDDSASLMPEITYDRDDEMYSIGISLASFFYLLDDIPDELLKKPEQWGSHLIEDDAAEDNLPHYHILPLETYRKVLALVRQMTEEDAHKRISFSAAIEKLTAMRDELKQAGEKISVGLLDIVKIDFNNPEAMIEFVRQSGVDEIHLVDSSGKDRSVLELLTIQRQLQEAGFRVGGICFTGVDIGKIEKAAAHFLANRPLPSQHRWIAVNQTLAAAAAAATISSSSLSSSSSSSPSSSLSDSPPDSPPVTMMMNPK